MVKKRGVCYTEADRKKSAETICFGFAEGVILKNKNDEEMLL